MASSWWEIQVLCHLASEELVFWRLEEFGCAGTSSQAQSSSMRLVQGYLSQEQAQLLDLSALGLRLRQDALCAELPIPTASWHLIEDEDWSSTWKSHWRAEPIGDRFLINPAWMTPPETDRLILTLDPGVAFGTGAHATTQLCLESLEMRLGGETANLVIADVGTGSGILAIGAILLGAGRVYAADVDIQAVEATAMNRALNQISPDRLSVIEGSVDKLAQQMDAPADGIICNILAEVIIDLIPQMVEISKPDTWGVLSGILLDQAKAVADTLEQNGWTVATLWRRQEWCCMNIRRSS